MVIGIALALASYVPAVAQSPLAPGQELALKPHESFRECKACPEMVVVPAGSFTMGSTVSEAPGGNESPPHMVTFAQPFAVGKFAVTFDEWDACVADGGCGGYRPADQGWGRGRRPVVNVSWADARTYLAWISHKTGKTYRLLSEAEREYVTRAGTTTPYWWGTSISTDQANFDGTYPGGKGSGQLRRQTVPVDSFAPNPFGLYQVHGNVWEWVEDCDHASYDGAPADGSAWTAGECIRRVLRGGFWSNPPRALRAAARSSAGPTYRNDGYYSLWGFRVARPLGPQARPQPARRALVVTPLSPERERALRPRDSFKECGSCPEMVVIPAGSFTMGSPRSEPKRFEDEEPQHQVTFARPFAVGRFAVTFDEWDACAADGSTDGLCYGYRPRDEGWGRSRRPVIYVGWSQAKAYVEWLSRKTGKTYRLLSEAEREYVTRAGTTTPFWWGSSISTGQANYDGNSVYDGGAKGEYRKQTVPVDLFAPNAFGLFQVHGNVSEWLEDCYDDSYVGAPSDGSAWTAFHRSYRGHDSLLWTADRACLYHVIRGGSWSSIAEVLRSAHRGGQVDVLTATIGFRVARTLGP